MTSILFGLIAFLWVAIVIWICPRLFQYCPWGDE